MGTNGNNRNISKVVSGIIAGTILAAFLLSVLPGVSAHGWKVPKAAQQEKNPVPSDAASIMRGKQIFLQYCAMCHGEKGDGHSSMASVLDDQPADLIAMAGKHTDGDVAWKIRNGRGAMPAFEKQLKPDSIWDVVNYIQSLDN